MSVVLLVVREQVFDKRERDQERQEVRNVAEARAAQVEGDSDEGRCQLFSIVDRVSELSVAGDE